VDGDDPRLRLHTRDFWDDSSQFHTHSKLEIICLVDAKPFFRFLIRAGFTINLMFLQLLDVCRVRRVFAVQLHLLHTVNIDDM
jgi:hypothetical protein